MSTETTTTTSEAILSTPFQDEEISAPLQDDEAISTPLQDDESIPISIQDDGILVDPFDGAKEATILPSSVPISRQRKFGSIIIALIILTAFAIFFTTVIISILQIRDVKNWMTLYEGPNGVPVVVSDWILERDDVSRRLAIAYNKLAYLTLLTIQPVLTTIRWANTSNGNATCSVPALAIHTISFIILVWSVVNIILYLLPIVLITAYCLPSIIFHSLVAQYWIIPQPNTIDNDPPKPENEEEEGLRLVTPWKSETQMAQQL